MNWKYFIGLTIVPTVFWIGTIAEAEEIRNRTRNINIYRDQNGGINVDTGKIQVNSSPSIFRSRRIPYGGQNLRGCYQRSVVRQSSRQTGQFSRLSNQTSISAYCR